MEKSQMNNRIKRIIIAGILVLVSLTLGTICGVKLTTINKNYQSNSFNQVTNILKNNWYSEIYYGEDSNEDVLIDQFVGALSTKDELRLDPYTYLIKNDNSASVVESGKLGITVSFFYNYPIVLGVLKDGACDQKLEVGDIIIATGKNDYGEFKIVDEDVNYSNILQLALGKAGEDVFINVARFDNDNKIQYYTYDITLSAKMNNESAYIKESKIQDSLFVKLTSFVSSKNNDDTAKQLKLILKENQAKNLIIDLLDNGGGDLSSVVNICDLFLPSNKIVTSLQYKDGSLATYKTNSDEYFQYEKIIVLMNHNTASASEILISTLQYYYPNQVTLIGCQSYGKGIAQRKENVLNNRYVLQYTCAKWLRPDNTWIGMKESKFEENYPLGFKPLKENEIEKSDLLKLMEKNNSYIYFKQTKQYNAFKIDQVSSVNRYFFEVLNLMTQQNIRTDYYFDQSSSEAIKNYQSKKNILNQDMNEETFLYFVKDFYNEKQLYLSNHINACERVINSGE